MKRIYVHPELMEVLEKIVDDNEGAKTKVAQTIIKAATEGMDEEAFIEDNPNYWSFANDTKDLVSYVKVDKLRRKLAQMNEIQVKSVTSEMMEEFNEDFYTTKITRTRSKVTKFISGLFKKEWISANFKNTDIEEFSNQYTALVKGSDEIFKIVKGEDIRKYYNNENYDTTVPSGTLMKSCMGHSNKSKFLDLYVKNDNVSLLVALSDGGKVIGRALLWDNVSFKEKGSMKEVHKGKFMDRVYYTNDWVEGKFLLWAKEEGIFTKRTQSHDDPTRFINPHNNETEEYYIEVEVNLEYQYYPYVDTMFIPNYKRGIITNKLDGYDTSTQMRSHDSGMPNMVWDSIEGKLVRSNESFWGEDDKTWIHRNDSISVKIDGNGKNFHKKLCIQDRLNGYITPVDEVIKCVISGDEFAKRDMIESEYHKGFIHKKESIESADVGLIHKDKSVKSEYLGSILSKDGSIFLPNIGDYLPKSVLDNGLSVEEFEKVIQTLNELKGETKQSFEDSSTFVFEF